MANNSAIPFVAGFRYGLRSSCRDSSHLRLGWLLYSLTTISGIGTLVIGLILTHLVTLAGLPFGVVSKLWPDPIARNGYFGAFESA